jgi:hypothetical protein
VPLKKADRTTNFTRSGHCYGGHHLGMDGDRLPKKLFTFRESKSARLQAWCISKNNPASNPQAINAMALHYLQPHR